MKILLIADREERALWDHWTASTAERFSDISLILSAGDLVPEYLEFLVTMLNVPLVYVRGNHDQIYEQRQPEGCLDADGRLIEVRCRSKDTEDREVKLRILGLGGSMRYKSGAADMYTEREMRARVRKAERTLAGWSLSDRLAGMLGNSLEKPAAPAAKGQPAGDAAFDILLTHAPCLGYGDLDDLPHTGFECFNYLLNKYSPQLHCYGHVHREYGQFFALQSAGGSESAVINKGFHRTLIHPSGTTLINANGHFVTELNI